MLHMFWDRNLVARLRAANSEESQSANTPMYCGAEFMVADSIYSKIQSGNERVDYLNNKTNN